jgi:hypothetical protein
MKRIIVDMSKGELDFIREALEVKHINLMSYLDTCEENANPKPSWDEVTDLSEEEFFAQVEAIKEEEKIFNYKPKKKAPYGYKKDGTPKNKPGRPTKEFFLNDCISQTTSRKA